MGFSSTLAWKTPYREGPGGLQSTGHKESGSTGAAVARTHCRWFWCGRARAVLKNDLRTLVPFACTTPRPDVLVPDAPRLGAALLRLPHLLTSAVLGPAPQAPLASPALPELQLLAPID